MAHAKPLDVEAGSRLNAHEIDILNGIARGLTARQIGKELQVTENTIRTYSKRIRIKLRALNSAHAVALGFAGRYLKVRQVKP
jgi:DNA-binding CsgD family transcriptional regulator